ncbi:MAG: hypothetical protein MRY57_04245 [Candidatus Pacebacteria bacterium]|nr:hypothetical protein [Candidatus Paceibacterota bacterium]
MIFSTLFIVVVSLVFIGFNRVFAENETNSSSQIKELHYQQVGNEVDLLNYISYLSNQHEEIKSIKVYQESVEFLIEKEATILEVDTETKKQLISVNYNKNNGVDVTVRPISGSINSFELELEQKAIVSPNTEITPFVHAQLIHSLIPTVLE